MKRLSSQTSQSGRSMVEMLGVLAVVGVLSIGGIMGYSYGMDKYRANEATNQIMLRAIDLMTQASQNRAELSLAEWENEPAQYDFSNPIYTTDDLIKLDVGTASNPIPKRVCEQIFEGMKSNALYIDINGKEMDVDPECDANNVMTFYFEGGGAQMDVCNPACGENEYCDNGICFKGGVPEMSKIVGDCLNDADCNIGFATDCIGCMGGQCFISGYDGADCTLTNGTAGQCNLGTCYPKGCTSNDDCKEQSGTYCASSTFSEIERFPNGETGSCVPIDFLRTEINGKNYYISNVYMIWWNAEYACDAIGREIVSVDDLVTESDGAKWEGDTGIHTRTMLTQELYNIIGGYPIWTKNLTSDRHVFGVNLSNGYVGGYLYFSIYLAVCK